MITFKDLEANQPIYILNTNDATLEEGKVISRSFPRVQMDDNFMNNPMNPSYIGRASDRSRRVVDIKIEAFGKTATYAMTEMASVNYSGNLIFATEKQNLLNDLRQIHKESEVAIDEKTIEKHRVIIQNAKTLMGELDPVYKAKQETDTKFKAIDSRMDSMESSVKSLAKNITDLIKELKN